MNTRKEYSKEYYLKNIDKIKQYKKDNAELAKTKRKPLTEEQKVKNKEYKKKLYELNKDRNRLYAKEYRNEHPEQKKNYYKDNKDKINEQRKTYNKNRKSIDPLYKLTCSIRTLINMSIRNKGYTKRSKTFQILGCTFDVFKEYLEQQFEPWMTWGNKGLYEKDKYNIGWDIDHIQPCCSAKTEVDIITLNHYTNFRPLCSKINRDEKKGKY